VTLDGRRNDGTAGQDALVGPDIENAGIGLTTPPSDAVLVGNDGPNVLVGSGTVRGLGGNDTLISNNLQGAGTTLDGGDAMTGSRLAHGTPPAPASPKRRRASPAGPAPTSSSRTLRRPPTASA
jgi:hypothetical protein